jgi:Fibrinogen beta and gamma chains, C-terminal globular domain/Stigma-specific protein, Stig1
MKRRVHGSLVPSLHVALLCTLAACSSNSPGGNTDTDASTTDTVTTDTVTTDKPVDTGTDAAPDITPDIVVDNGPMCATGQMLCAGRCADLTSDSANCGACGTACAAGMACRMGSCQLVCPEGQTACSGRCVSLMSDGANCGACGTACPAGQVCSMGACNVMCGTLTTCGTGAMRTCADVNIDPRNCGACGTACNLANASVNACAGGMCVVGACNAGFANCDSDPANGCEVNVRGTDANNCGACGVACRFANAAATCAMGTCAMGACNAGFADCDMNPANGCEVNINTDNANCGRCGGACTATQVCTAGACASSCAATATNCSGDCVNTAIDPRNCGGCGMACNLANASVNACVASRCVIGGCSAGFADCDGMAATGCETNVRGSDENNCGGCGVACRFTNASATCGMGTCALGTCNMGFGNCDMNPANGCEVNVNTDNANCGACGRACAAGQVCAAGACVTTCAAGTTNCSGDCVNTGTDPRNCGACGRACSLANVAVNACVAGGCVIGGCSTGFGDCDGMAANGCETNVRASDVSNCGGCGVVCRFANAAASCALGACALGTCATGFANCDASAANGCEVNVNTDNGNCGACGRACAAGQVCAAGTCMTTCASGTTNCSGTCANLMTDTANCGTCGTACALANVSTNACTGGACVVGACTTGFGNCNGTASDGCEVNLNTSVTHCGRCGNTCATGLTCVAGTCTSTVLGGTAYQVVGLSPDACSSIEHATFSGDDRGGIALSSTNVFYRGDTATARFSATDLSGAASTGAGQDGLFSDLATQQIYAFGTAAGPWVFDFSSTVYTIDRFYAINGTTGAVGAATMLSAPLVFQDYSAGNASQGIFSGMGRVVVVTAGRVYDIALPSGVNVDRGAFTFPAHTICESANVFGVAEFFGGALYIDYVQSSTVIARQQVAPTVGAPTTLAAFSNLSDMCSFTVSPGTNRWYWHHEGTSQFRSGDESIGFCNMTRRNCRDVLASGRTTSGVYTIDPDGAGGVAPFDVYCDMTTNGGGWTLAAIRQPGIAMFAETARTPLLPTDANGRSANIWASNNTSFPFTAIRYTNTTPNFAIATFASQTTLNAQNTAASAYVSAPIAATVSSSVPTLTAFYWRAQSGAFTPYSDSSDWAYMAFAESAISTYGDGWDVSRPYWILSGTDNTYDPLTSTDTAVGLVTATAGCHWHTTCTSGFVTQTLVWLR